MKQQRVRRLALSYLAVIMTLLLAALNSMMFLVGYWRSVLVVPSSWMSSHMATGCKIHRPVTVMQMNWTIGWRTCGIRD